MILNKPLVDYCTLTSFDKGWFNEVYNDYKDIGEVSETKFQGYEGVIVTTPHGSVSMVVGSQVWKGKGGTGDKTMHFMVRWSGEMSDGAPQYYRQGVKCKRIDVQVTRREDRTDLLDFFEFKLREGEKFYKGKGRKIVPHYHRSDTRTLYYGARSGDKFFRLYQKKGQGGGIEFLRWEYELKKKQAEWAIGMLCEGLSPGDLFRSCVGNYHEGYAWITEPYLNACSGGQLVEYAREQNRDTLTWLKSLTGTVERLARNHQTRYETIRLINEWYDMVNQIGHE